MDEWSNFEREFLSNLASPLKIQQFLDDIVYDSGAKNNYSPRYVIKNGRANCFEGALFGAAALESLGYEPLIIDMVAKNDDDHLIAVYKMFDRWGSIAKSNTTVLRGREPVYKNIRELVMSYFDFYMNTDGEKTLRGYTKTINLKIFDKYNWRTTKKELDSTIGEALTQTRHRNILNDAMEENLSKTHPLVLKATLLGADIEGLYKMKN